VIVVMSHVDKDGNPKIVKECTLPLTSKGCVHAIITDMAVMEVTKKGLLVTELMSPYTIEDIRTYTGAKFAVSPSLSTIY